jgi:hypothetical protein
LCCYTKCYFSWGSPKHRAFGKVRLHMMLRLQFTLHEQGVGVWIQWLWFSIETSCGLLRKGFVCFWRDSPQWARASSFTRFLDHTQRRNTVDRTPLDEWSARSRDLYLTTNNTHNRQTSLPSVGFEPTTPAGERPQTYTLDRAATGIRMNRVAHIITPML